MDINDTPPGSQSGAAGVSPPRRTRRLQLLLLSMARGKGGACVRCTSSPRRSVRVTSTTPTAQSRRSRKRDDSPYGGGAFKSRRSLPKGAALTVRGKNRTAASGKVIYDSRGVSEHNEMRRGADGLARAKRPCQRRAGPKNRAAEHAKASTK